MLTTPSAQTQMDRYLNELGSHLVSLPEKLASDIIEEIRSHILDAAVENGSVAPANVRAVLADLGSPSSLAAIYLQNISGPTLVPMPKWSEARRSIPRRFSFSLRATRAVILAFLAYGAAGTALICAFSKVFNPERAGLWRIGANEFSLHLGLNHAVAPPVGQDLLGWYIVPLGLIIGTFTLLLTTEILRRSLSRLRSEQMQAA